MAPKKKDKSDKKADKSDKSGGKHRSDDGPLNTKKVKPHDEEKHKKNNWNLFATQLASFGLTLRDAKADGNCMFRALADQLEGNQSNHAEYRKTIVDFMEDEPDDYAPFVTEDWAAYCKRMRKDGTWGGHLELNAASRCFLRHIIIHQLNAPRLEIRHPSLPDTGTIHLAYHDQEHYSSVRDRDDRLFGPAQEIRLHQRVGKKTSASIPATAPPPPLTPAERIVMQTTGCNDLEQIRTVLKECWNDADAACEIIEAEKYEEKRREEEQKQKGEREAKYQQEHKSEQQQLDEAIAASLSVTSAASSTTATSTSTSTSTSKASIVTKNDPCPCGSGKKYKSCCKHGASSSSSSASSSHHHHTSSSTGKYAKSHDYSQSSSTADDDDDDDTSHSKPSVSKHTPHLTNKQRKAIAKSEKLATKQMKKKERDVDDAIADGAIHDFGSLAI